MKLHYLFPVFLRNSQVSPPKKKRLHCGVACRQLSVKVAGFAAPYKKITSNPKKNKNGRVFCASGEERRVLSKEVSLRNFRVTEFRHHHISHQNALPRGGKVSSANRRVQFCNFMVGYVRIMFESFSNRPDASCDLRHKS